MKTILITGASAGFGEATAKVLAAKGYKLILIARRGERLGLLKNLLKTNIYTAVVDVTDRKQVKDFFARLPDEFKSIDVLINNAGMASGIDPAQDASIDNWEQMVDTNIKGLLYMTRYTLDIMKEKGEGLIVNLGSVAAHVPYKGGNVYGASKAFVWQFSRGLRTDLLGTGIKVTNIEPGAAATEFAVVRFKDQQKGKEFYEGWSPLQAEDVANTIVWVINQPKHVNIDNVEVMALSQTFAGMVINKR